MQLRDRASTNVGGDRRLIEIVFTGLHPKSEQSIGLLYESDRRTADCMGAVPARERRLSLKLATPTHLPRLHGQPRFARVARP